MSEAREKPPACAALEATITPLQRDITSMIEHLNGGAPDGAQCTATHSGEGGHWHRTDPADQRARGNDPPLVPGSARPSAVELRRLVVALLRAGRTPEALSRELEPTVREIWNWVMQVARDAGRSANGLSSVEREELKRLRREVRQLREERDGQAKADPWFVREIDVIPSRAAN